MSRERAVRAAAVPTADPHLEYLRRELRACEVRYTILQIGCRGTEDRADLMERIGTRADRAALAAAAERGAAVRVDALRKNLENQATWRSLIAEHLARRNRQRVEPIRAKSDAGAIFELLAQVGGR